MSGLCAKCGQPNVPCECEFQPHSVSQFRRALAQSEVVIVSKNTIEIAAVRYCRQQESEGEFGKLPPVDGGQERVCEPLTGDNGGVVVEITVEDRTVLLPPEIENGKYSARLTRIEGEE